MCNDAFWFQPKKDIDEKKDEEKDKWKGKDFSGVTLPTKQVIKMSACFEQVYARGTGNPWNKEKPEMAGNQVKLGGQ